MNHACKLYSSIFRVLWEYIECPLISFASFLFRFCSWYKKIKYVRWKAFSFHSPSFKKIIFCFVGSLILQSLLYVRHSFGSHKISLWIVVFVFLFSACRRFQILLLIINPFKHTFAQVAHRLLRRSEVAFLCDRWFADWNCILLWFG